MHTLEVVQSISNSFGDVCQHRNYFQLSFSGEGQGPSLDPTPFIFKIFFICCCYYYYKVVQMLYAVMPVHTLRVPLIAKIPKNQPLSEWAWLYE